MPALMTAFNDVPESKETEPDTDTFVASIKLFFSCKQGKLL